jgi:hypothetical protein
MNLAATNLAAAMKAAATNLAAAMKPAAMKPATTSRPPAAVARHGVRGAAKRRRSSSQPSLPWPLAGPRQPLRCVMTDAGAVAPPRGAAASLFDFDDN